MINQLSGVLYARELAAEDSASAEQWRAERRAALADLDSISPGTVRVETALARYSARLAELRGSQTGVDAGDS